MKARWLLWCACATAACRGTPTVTADDLIVTATVRPDTFSLARDTAPIRVTIVARNPEAHPVDVDTRGALRMPLGPGGALFGEPGAKLSSGAGFALRVVQSDETVWFTFTGAGGSTVRFRAGESKTWVERLTRTVLLQHAHAGAPGTYLLIPSYAQNEARPLRLVLTR